MRLGRKHRTRLAEIIDDCVVSEAQSMPMLAPTPHHAQVSEWLGEALGLRSSLHPVGFRPWHPVSW